MNGQSRDPDLQKIAKIGKVGDSDDLATAVEDDEDFKRFLPMEFLKKMPGIDSNNVKHMLKEGVKNMMEVTKMGEEELKKVLGPRNAKEFKTFLTKKVEVVKDQDTYDQ